MTTQLKTTPTMKFKIDDPKVWQQACEAMVSMAVKHAQSSSKPEHICFLRNKLRFLLSDYRFPATANLWTPGHITKLRRIYMAAFNGMRFCNLVESAHRKEIGNLP